MASLTDGAEDRSLKWLLGQATTAPVLPLMVRLMTINGSDSVAGTEVVGGTYAPQALDETAVAGGASSNETLLRFEGIPNPTTVVGVELWDSGGVPFRWWWGPLAVNKTVTDGVLEFPIGDLDLSQS